MSLPATTIEMTRTGNSNEPSLIIRQSPILEPTNPRRALRAKAPFGILTDAARGHIIAMIGEYLGTFMLYVELFCLPPRYPYIFHERLSGRGLLHSLLSPSCE